MFYPALKRKQIKKRLRKKCDSPVLYFASIFGRPGGRGPVRSCRGALQNSTAQNRAKAL